MKLIQLDKIVKLIPFFIGLVWFKSVMAVEVNDLYQAEVPVNSQSTADRSTALKEAMKAVVLKVGGQESVLNHTNIKAAVKRYNNYLTQFHYGRKSVKTQSSEQLYLVAQFNEDKINQLFQQAELALWGRLRPQILVWVIEEKGLNREVLADSANSQIPGDIISFSKSRGLPLNLPLMDLDDANAIEMSDLWGRFANPIRAMSARYLSDAILIIRSSNSSLLASNLSDEENCSLVLCAPTEEYVVDWTLIAEQQVFGKSYEGHDQNQLVKQVLSDVADNIYQRYALSTGMNNDYVIDVANITSLSEHVALIEFLENLASVETAMLIEANGDNQRIKLKLLGSKQALLASLGLNKQLKQYVDPLVPPSIDDIPVFYWGAP